MELKRGQRVWFFNTREASGRDEDNYHDKWLVMLNRNDGVFLGNLWNFHANTPEREVLAFIRRRVAERNLVAVRCNTDQFLLRRRPRKKK